MVLEHIYPLNWLAKHTYFAFVLGFFYTVLSIFSSLILFPKDPALVAVAFTSLLMLPSLYLFFGIEEKQEEKESRFRFKRMVVDNMAIFKIYLFSFLGILLAFSLFSILLPSLASNHLFREQIAVLGISSSQVGGAFFSTSLMTSILFNNLKVLIFCFLISLLAGNGAIFLITWNASVWGTVFGLIAKSAAYTIGKNPFYIFFIITLSVGPHLILEVAAYILASISGSVISRDILKERSFSNKFNNILIYNIVLLLVSIAILILAAIVETYVLNNFETYRHIREITF